MADIAFLLLIFFLVTTTIETDAGLDRMLPPDRPANPLIEIRQRNMFMVHLNKEGDLFVEEQRMELGELRRATMDFLDNGGDGSCTYCQGPRDPAASDNPDKAVISIQSDRETKYAAYIAVQNELIGAYNELRNRESQRLFGRDFTEMEAVVANPETSREVREELKGQLKRIREMFPQKISEAETRTP